MSKKIRDETIIEALLISATVRSAAVKLEINEQTIYRRKRDPEFMQKYNEARRERTEAARNVLQERAHAAADTLATIMQDKNAPAQTRVSAAKPRKGISDGAGSTRLFIRLRERYHYRPLGE